jgi:Spy/CpxP family protein refolding chaperone
MKTMKKIAVFTMAIMLMSGTSLFAQNGRNYSKQGNVNYRNQDQVCNRIPDLTEDQQVKIEALRVNHLKERTALRNQTNELRAKKQTLMTSDNADMKEINSVIDQMTELQNKKLKESAQHRQNVRNLLTDDQKVYFDSRPGRGHRNGMRSGNRGGRGQGNGQGTGNGRN